MPSQLHTIISIAKSHIEYTINELTIIIQNDISELKSKNPKFKTTLNTFAAYVQHITNLTRGTYKLIKDENLYSSRILLHSLIEHAFIVDFLARNAIEDKSDNTCKEFLAYCKSQQENIQQVKTQLLYKHPEHISLKSKPSESHSIFESTYASIQKDSGKFCFTEIFNYLRNSKGSHVSDVYNKGIEFYQKYYAVYSDLSLTVHGNEFPEKSKLNFNDSFENEFDTLGIIEALIDVHFFACLSIIGFFAFLDKKFEDKIMKIIDIQLEFYKKF